MITIASKQHGFRRCGVPHPKEPTEYADDAFTPEQVEIMQADAMLTVTVVADEKKPKKAEGK